jgi:L-aspartate oxidase
MRTQFMPGTEAKTCPKPQRFNFNNAPLRAENLRTTIHNVMERSGGVVREGAKMQQGLMMLETLANRLPPADSRANCEAINIYEVAMHVIRSAIARKESRGAHYRTDFPTRNDAEFQKHSVLHRRSVRFED